MKVNLLCKKENREKIEEMLKNGGFELSKEGDFILYENNYVLEHIITKLGEDLIIVKVDNIVMIESLGNDIFVYDNACKMKAKERIYMLEQMLPVEKFVRISQSVIINKKCIKRISPSFGMKFILTMANGLQVDVTRSYYQKFKDFIGF